MMCTEGFLSNENMSYAILLFFLRDPDSRLLIEVEGNYYYYYRSLFDVPSLNMLFIDQPIKRR